MCLIKIKLEEANKCKAEGQKDGRQNHMKLKLFCGWVNRRTETPAKRGGSIQVDVNFL